MKTLFWVVALFALAVGLVVAARYNEGYVLVVFPPYRIEVSVNFFQVSSSACRSRPLRLTLSAVACVRSLLA